MKCIKSTETPDTTTDKSKLAADVQQLPALPGLWSIEQLMVHIPVCRRTIHNLRKKGLPTIVLGRRLFWHPPSVEAWLIRQQRGADQ